MFLKYNRRNAIGLIFIGSGIALGGCAPILRLVVGRGAAGLLRSAGRIGGPRAALSYGRGISVGQRISVGYRHSLPRTSIVGKNGKTISNYSHRLPGTNIVDKNGKAISTTETTTNGHYVLVNGSKVFYSKHTDYGYQHVAKRGDVGRSINRGDKGVEHRDHRGRTTSFDRIRTAKKIIDHLDANQNKIGETSYSVHSNETWIEADAGTIASIEDIEYQYGLNCPDSKQAYDDWMEYLHTCRSNDQTCRLSSMKESRYHTLAKRCKEDTYKRR